MGDTMPEGNFRDGAFPIIKVLSEILIDGMKQNKLALKLNKC